MNNVFGSQTPITIKALQVKIDDNKSVIMYNPGIHFGFFDQGDFQIMLLDIRKTKGIYLVCSKTDLRCDIG